MGLDEAHAAHVGGEVVDHPGALGGGPAGLEQVEVAHLVLDARRLLVPLGERLDVDAADPVWPRCAGREPGGRR